MPKELYEWFIQHPYVKVKLYYDTIFNQNQICIHMQIYSTYKDAIRNHALRIATAAEEYYKK